MPYSACWPGPPSVKASCVTGVGEAFQVCLVENSARLSMAVCLLLFVAVSVGAALHCAYCARSRPGEAPWSGAVYSLRWRKGDMI